jgi:hypothetical protein
MHWHGQEAWDIIWPILVFALIVGLWKIVSRLMD